MKKKFLRIISLFVLIVVFLSSCSYNADGKITQLQTLFKAPIYEDEYIKIWDAGSDLPIENTQMMCINLKVKNKSDKPINFNVTDVAVKELNNLLDNDDIEVAVLKPVYDEMLYPGKSAVYDFVFSVGFGDQYNYTSYRYYELSEFIKRTIVELQISLKTEDDVLINQAEISFQSFE